MDALYIYRGDSLEGKAGEALIREAAALYAESERIRLSEGYSIEREKHGRPYLSNGLFSFSVSHSAGLWGCLFSRERACGMDLQVMKNLNASRILKRFFTEEEYAYADRSGLEGFYRLWTRREAFGKWTGRGMFSELPDLRKEKGVWEGCPYFFSESRISVRKEGKEPGELCLDFFVTVLRAQLSFPEVRMFGEPNEKSKKEVRVVSGAETPTDFENSAFESALKKLSYRDMTEQEIRKYLQKKGFSRESSSEAVWLLKEYRYIDDARYAFQYFRYGIEKRKGRDRIRRELLQKGAEESSIEKGWNDYLDEYGEPDEEAMAEEEAQAVLRSAGFGDEEPHKEIPDKILGRIARRLSSKGYRPAVIYQVLDHFR